jgi:hypothetical protein
MVNTRNVEISVISDLLGISSARRLSLHFWFDLLLNYDWILGAW